MNKVRIIPSILTDGFSQVKGTNFDNWRTVGSVVQAIKLFGSRDVDELVLLDTKATAQNRLIDVNLVQEMAKYLRIPFAVGGGIKTVDDIALLLRAGADKVILGTAGIRQPELILDASNIFGSQALIGAIDVQDSPSRVVAVRSGSVPLELSPLAAAVTMIDNGIGELLVQSITREGTRTGLDLELIREITAASPVPVIASGGASCYEDFLDGVRAGASAISAGAIFQFTHLTPAGARSYLRDNGVPVRN